jgi:hypothetical protein
MDAGGGLVLELSNWCGHWVQFADETGRDELFTVNNLEATYLEVGTGQE